MSANEKQESTAPELQDMAQPAEELSAEAAQDVKGGWGPPPWTATQYTAWSTNVGDNALLGSEAAVIKR